MHERACMKERERERERERESGGERESEREKEKEEREGESKRVRERGRERVRECVCVRERERERERDSLKWCHTHKHRKQNRRTEHIALLLLLVTVDTFVMSPKGDDKLTVWEGQTSKIVCTATRSRPAVTIKWYLTNYEGTDIEMTEGVSQTESPNPIDSETFDVESTFFYTANRNTHGYTLKCKTTGQLAAPSKEETSIVNVLCKFHHRIVLYFKFV